jgi:hypothetical protein
MNLFEDRSTYDHSKDAVEHITVNIECHPGVITSVIEHIVALGVKAGMYSASVTHETVEPVVEPVVEPEGVPDVEQPIQRALLVEPTVDRGEGSIPEKGGATEVPVEYVGSELAGTTGEIPKGSESGDSGGEDLRPVEGIVGRE